MARTATKELHSSDVDIEQKDDIEIDTKNREPDVIVAAHDANKAYFAELAFNEEPVTVRLEPRSEENSATTIEVWNNGKGGEVWNEQQKRWMEITHLPLGQVITIKRKYLATLAGSKHDRIKTAKTNVEDLNGPNNIVQRFTSATCSFSVIEDRNPRGARWLTELLRRNG